MKMRVNEGLAADRLNDLSSTLTLLETRRSASAKTMTEPGPSAEQLERLLAIATRVPDHGKLCPWRFIVFEGEARACAGDVLAERWQQLNPEHGEATINEQRNMFLRAPVVIAVVSRTQNHPKIPVWEQELSAGASCQNIVIAATAMGLGCQWITGWYAFDRTVLARFGLDDGEKIAGFMFLGTSTEDLVDRQRPEYRDLVCRWKGEI